MSEKTVQQKMEYLKQCRKKIESGRAPMSMILEARCEGISCGDCPLYVTEGEAQVCTTPKFYYKKQWRGVHFSLSYEQVFGHPKPEKKSKVKKDKVAVNG